MNENENLVPKRRFKEFKNTGTWEQRKLGELINLENGFAFKSEYFQEDPSDVIVLTPGNVNIGGGFQSGKGRFYNIAGKFPDKFIFKPGDIFVTMTDLTPSGQTLGLPAIVPDDGITYLHNQRLGKLVNFSGDREFLFYVFNTEDYHKHIVATASGTTVKHSSSSKILDYVVHIPIIEEQTKIGAFLNKLDNTIALHQRKLEKSKALKSAYLSEMFPAEGERKPKRRFAGFTDDWEQRKLIDVAEMFDNLRIPVTASDRVEGNTAYYGANGIQDYVDGFTHDGEFVLIAEDGANDLINYPVNYVKGKIWVNNHAHVVSGKKSELDNLFLTARIKSMNISHWLVGGGRAKLNGDVLKKIPLTLPIYEEQKKIGAFFKQLDDAITLHQHKLEKLQNIKQAYLNEMFV